MVPETVKETLRRKLIEAGCKVEDYADWGLELRITNFESVYNPNSVELIAMDYNYSCEYSTNNSNHVYLRNHG